MPRCSECESRTLGIPDRIMAFVFFWARSHHMRDANSVQRGKRDRCCAVLCVRYVEKRSYRYPERHGGKLHIAFSRDGRMRTRDIGALLGRVFLNPWDCSPEVALYDAFRSPKEAEIQSGERRLYGGVVHAGAWDGDWT
jgi:hypothetical protein